MNLNEHEQSQPAGASDQSGNHPHADSGSSLKKPGWSTRRRTIIAISLLLALGAIAYFWHPWKRSASEVAEAGVEYTCPMHPQVVRDKPGVCPICQMDLVPKSTGKWTTGATTAKTAPTTTDDTTTSAHAAVSTPATIELSQEDRIAAGVKTVAAANRYLNNRLTVSAGVDFNEGTHKVVTARYSGRIERLFINQTGESVRRGQALMSIYSPVLVTAQQDYLIARQTGNLHALPMSGLVDNVMTMEHEKRDQQLLTASRKRLELLGMSAAQISALDQRGEISYTTTVVSAVSGVVLTRGVTEGAYVNEGTSLIEVADLGSVWVLANVYESDIYRVKPGMQMEVTGPALGGEKLFGRVEYIYPIVDAATRTVRVRGVFVNPGLRLKPGMYLTASVLIPSVDALVVPANAVIRTGKRDLVYVEVAKNSFALREVTVGVKDGDDYQITSGSLKVGDRVVAEGGYLLDSESRLRGTGDH